MNRIRDFFSHTFESLSVRNYRLFFYGQAISLSGSWMQRIAQGLLVLELTGSGTALGVVIALQALPVLLFGAWGGVIADRLPKRSILYATQSAAGLSSLVMGTLIVTGLIELWMVFVLAVVLGFVKVFDTPTRQTFVREMVGTDLLTNAISLNSMELNLARVIGPSIAGVLVATVGLGACFLIDGVSYIVVIYMLVKMKAEELHPATRLAKAKGQLVEGMRYAWSEPVLRNTLFMMAIIGMLTFEWSVSLPILAEFTFLQGASGYAALSAAMGIGAVVGGLYTAGRRASNLRMLAISASLFGVSILVVAIMPTLHAAVAAILIMGFFSINYTSLANVTLQLNSAPDMQGRVMSLWMVAFLGSKPIGGPIIGAIGEHAGARWALVVGGIAALVAAAVGVLGVYQQRQKEATEGPTRTLMGHKKTV